MTEARQRAFVGLGSNLQEPLRQVRDAVRELDSPPETRVLGVSRFFSSAAVGPAGQPDYVNAAVCLETTLDPHALLGFLQGLEDAHGRVRDQHWGPRTLDLDLLLYGDTVINSPTLTVPHPLIGERAFVLMPLNDLDPSLSIPGVGRVNALLGEVSTADVKPIESATDAS